MHTRTHTHIHTLQSHSAFRCVRSFANIHKKTGKKKCPPCVYHMMFLMDLIWRCESLAPSATSDTVWIAAIISPGSYAPLLHSPGGRLVCIVSLPSRQPSGGRCFDKCCPYCPVRCTCRSIQKFKAKNSALQLLCRSKPGKKEDTANRNSVLTLYHREYSTAHITSSRTTRCRDTSSPVLEDVRFN